MLYTLSNQDGKIVATVKDRNSERLERIMQFCIDNFLALDIQPEPHEQPTKQHAASYLGEPNRLHKKP